MGERNEGGERVIDFAMAFDLALVNTYFAEGSREVLCPVKK